VRNLYTDTPRIFLVFVSKHAWYDQLLYHDAAGRALHGDPSRADKGRIGLYMKLCDFTLLFMILQVELRLNKDH